MAQVVEVHAPELVEALDIAGREGDDEVRMLVSIDLILVHGGMG